MSLGYALCKLQSRNHSDLSLKIKTALKCISAAVEGIGTFYLHLLREDAADCTKDYGGDHVLTELGLIEEGKEDDGEDIDDDTSGRTVGLAGLN